MTLDNDRIERQIDIDAPRDRVWALISEPGWWINGGTIARHRLEEADGLTLVHDDTHGVFPVRVELLDEPRYAAFRWMPGAPSTLFDEAGSTLVEFWIEVDAGDSDGVTVRVVESGFCSLPLAPEARSKTFDENTEGWEIELAAARTAIAE
jgi:uncharacterized protein YndB with AHSA1/START domain